MKFFCYSQVNDKRHIFCLQEYSEKSYQYQGKELRLSQYGGKHCHK